jgi:hypothetical protein
MEVLNEKENNNLKQIKNKTYAEMSKSYPKKINRRPKKTYTKITAPYRKYKEENIKKIIEYAIDLEKKKVKNFIKETSKKYKIPESTLKRKIIEYKKNPTTNFSDKRGKQNSIFNEKEEREMATIIANEYIDKKKSFDNSDLKELACKTWNKIQKDTSNLNKENTIIPDLSENKIKSLANENIKEIKKTIRERDIIEEKEIIKKEDENKEKNDQQKDINFSVSNGWCSDYKKKWGFSSVRPRKSRISSNNNENDIINFLNECYKGLTEVKLSNFFNMDETYFLYINMPISTFGYTGSESTQIAYVGNEKQGFTSILCVSAAGCLLKPIVIKKGKTARSLTKVELPENFMKCYSNSGWINCGILKILLDDINKHAKGEPAILILDQYSTHTDDYIINEAKKLNIKLIFVPAGLTGKLQPLDVGVNGPIKAASKKIYKKSSANIDGYKINLNAAIRHLYDAITKVVNKKLVIDAFNKALQIELLSENLEDNSTQALLNNTNTLLKNKPPLLEKLT